MKSKRGCVISLWHALLFFFMFFALEAFLLRRLLTDLRGGDLFGRYRYPLRVEYVPQISQMYTDFSCFNFLPFHLFPPFLISHFSLLALLSFFTFLLFYLFTFKKSRCQKIEKNKQNIKRKLHYFFYFCREILNL